MAAKGGEKGTDFVEIAVLERACRKGAVGCADKDKHRRSARKLWQRLCKKTVVCSGRSILFNFPSNGVRASQVIKR